jgi:DNA-binding LacI/PurR family transcriptional regulator
VGRTRIAQLTGLDRAGLAPATGRAHYGDWSEAWGRRAAEVVLRRAPDLDAIFCGNDQIARGAADTLRERGVRVPDDVAIVGYDNWDSMALASRPPPTTIDMDLGEIGRVAALRLLAQIDPGTADAGSMTVPGRLVVRESA